MWWKSEMNLAQATIKALNKPSPILPSLHWETKLSPVGVGWDVDLFLLMNLQRTEWSYPSRLVTFTPARECPRSPVDVTVIGASFTTAIAIALQQTGCTRRVAQYFYLNDLVGFTGDAVDGQIKVQRNLLASEMKYDRLLELRSVDALILEESEVALADRPEQRGSHGSSISCCSTS